MMSEIAIEGMLRAMALVMGADGAWRADERAALIAAYAQRVGRPPAAGALDAAIALSPAEALAWLADHAGALSAAEKEDLLGAAVEVCMADAELQDEELATLTRLARTLAVPPGALRGIMNATWRRARQG